MTRIGLAVLALAGCTDASSSVEKPPERPAPVPPAPLAPAPALGWSDSKLSLEVPGGARRDRRPRLDAFILAGSTDDPLQLRLAWSGLPASTVAFGEERVTTEHGGGKLTAALPDQASIRIDTGKSIVSQVPVEIALRGHEVATTRLPPLYLDSALRQVLPKVVDRPIRFPGETDDPHVDTAVILSVPLQYLGKGTTLGELDWIVFVTKEPTGKVKKCSGYLGAHRTIEVSYVEQRVVIHDRRTGAVVAKTTIAPPGGCPAHVVVGAAGKATTSPPYDAPEKWVRKQLGLTPSRAR